MTAATCWAESGFTSLAGMTVEGEPETLMSLAGIYSLIGRLVGRVAA